MISPPGEGPVETASSWTLTKDQIVLDTGNGARIEMDKDVIRIIADDLVEIWGKKRGVNLHAPAAGGKANLFTGDSFTVNCKSVSITASNDLGLKGKDVNIVGTSSVHVTSPAEVTITGGGVAKLNGGQVLINGPGLPAGRVTDIASGTIQTGSSTVRIGGVPTAVPGATTPLGPFDSQDAAAKAVLNNANPRSIAENKEYAGFIYQDPATGKYYATNPQALGPTGGNFTTDLMPPGAKEVGMYHTHGDYSLADWTRTDKAHDAFNSDQFSQKDIDDAKANAGGDPNYRSYLGTPSGDHLVYNPAPPGPIGRF
jgi:hypothetical protein